MFNSKRIFLAVAAALALVSQAEAAVGLVSISVNDVTVASTGFISQDGPDFNLPNVGPLNFDTFMLGSIGLQGLSDPALSYSFGVTNTTAAVETFNFFFVTSVTPITTATKVKASFQGTLTNNTDGVAATVSPVSGLISQAYALDSSLTPVPLGVDLGGTLTTGAMPSGTQVNYPSGLYAPGPGAGNFMPGPTPATSFIGLAYTVHFSLTAGDSFSANGRVELDPVPEPESALMMVLGLLGTAFVLRRRIA